MIMKTVKQLHSAVRDDIGDLTTRRPVPGPTIAQIDPFLFLNHHGPQTYRPGNGGLPRCWRGAPGLRSLIPDPIA